VLLAEACTAAASWSSVYSSTALLTEPRELRGRRDAQSGAQSTTERDSCLGQSSRFGVSHLSGHGLATVRHAPAADRMLPSGTNEGNLRIFVHIMLCIIPPVGWHFWLR
jgi:hypothetical protein